MDAHLRELRYFVAVAEELHFTRAAERLFVSQPALSKQIRALETTLGFRLFRRGTRGVRLTPAGEAFLPAARAAIAAFARGFEAARALADRRVFTVGMQTAVGRNLQRPALQRFRELTENWTVSMRLVGWHDPTAGLGDGSSDVAFVWLPVPGDGLRTRVLARERRWVALPSGHRLAEHTEVAFADLLVEPFIALPHAAGPLRDFWLAADARDGRKPVIGSEATSPDEVFEAVASGLGVALLAEGNVGLYRRPGVACRPVTGLAPAELAVAWRTDDHREVLTTFLHGLLTRPADDGDGPDPSAVCQDDSASVVDPPPDSVDGPTRRARH
ncbi:LysR family transcriptional regulator [Micromonospora sp. KC723]|uniref:LysR family transcriptional regulator n=1 Tax=Micromonospora sp. KC723 TaxID=2530381 RepID=UPI001048CA32|nr:LysR substrate-binding domain-containing protein [Micromonospora sp. KC723]TDB76251.1 LysR family transcriptional regulator [Micromonospora sp. KC723]